ncbi:NUDIX hydrolase [Maribellus sp. YY47]|uniref:NUDIX hydrolase n=1 Tax=Maribellus sp. YY47 TaxID=2929486 RepID=UPI0020009664|nr:NUDIX hydrolase [Maribellus sp. YY47]MCK3683289.1 NUDIX hydrolase [Maribellus sp. YY47]
MIFKNLSIDCVIFGFRDNKLNVLLWQPEPEIVKKLLILNDVYLEFKEIYENNPALKSDKHWGLIGMHLPVEEDLNDYTKKILEMATGLQNIYLKQFQTFGGINRIPHTRVLTVAYYALINPEYHDLKLSPVAKAVKWFDIDNLPDVAYDAKDIISHALKTLREEAKYHPVGFHLLPDKFTLNELQTLYEVILGKTLDTRNFRKKILNMNLLMDTGEKQKHVAHRAAKLFSFDMEMYNKLREEGLNFSI